jgi:peptidoglycan/xylan/chitin deacetylase (PgdA/CDA1 family)/predicted lipoprotein with Yx(FWY)xxD motif
MTRVRPACRRAARILTAALVAGAMVAALPASANAQPRPQTGAAPRVPGYGEVAPPKVNRPAPLPRRTGSVAVTRTATRTGLAANAAAAGANDRVALRALVVATDSNDFGVATWKATLDRVGAAYDVLYDSTTPLTADTLVGADGVGKYNAILLTNSMQIYASGGTYLNGLTSDEWNLIWAYERNFGVRQAALYTSYGTWPEDYCLRAAGETSVGDTPLNLSLTSAGAGVFDYLKPTATIPLQQSYVYDTTIAPGCSADATLTDGTNVLGVRSTSTDGRERIALTFTSNQYLMQSDLLVFGLFRWATKGLYLGEQRHYLNVDIDDWFNTSDHYYPDGHIEYTPGWQDTAHDMVNLDNQQIALRTAYPQAAQFEYNLAYNGSDIDPFAGNTCSPDGGVNELTATTKCLATHFRWLNHTWDHPELNSTDYATTYSEINQNRTAGKAIGLTPPDDVLKTPEYSGLGVYTEDPNCDTCVPVDHGLAASNPNMLQAAKDLGVKYLHGNMSFPSEVPAHFNANIVHPLEPSLSIVPDWTTNIAYFVTTPDEATAFYNSLYGPAGKFPYFSADQTYDQVVANEARIALQHVLEGSVNTTTFHIANTNDYGSGKTLVGDWVQSVVSQYSSYYSTPLLTPDWSGLGAYTTERDAHFAQLDAGVVPVYDRSAGTVTVTSPLAGTVEISGVQTDTSSTYGSDVTAPVALAANTAVTVPAVPRA